MLHIFIYTHVYSKYSNLGGGLAYIASSLKEWWGAKFTSQGHRTATEQPQSSQLCVEKIPPFLFPYLVDSSEIHQLRLVVSLVYPILIGLFIYLKWLFGISAIVL